MRAILFSTVLSVALVNGCSSSAASKSDNCTLVVKHAKEIMQTYDKDNDGRLSPTEWGPIVQQLDSMARQTNRETGSAGGDDNAAQIRERDIDHDGYLDLKEIAVVPAGEPGKWRSCL
jgi:Ca2+-binding EF-hand superfamily protein